MTKKRPQLSFFGPATNASIVKLSYESILLCINHADGDILFFFLWVGIRIIVLLMNGEGLQRNT